MIHPTAIIHPSAKLADNVTVGPFSIVGENVTIDEGTVVASHAVIKGETVIGKRNQVFQFCSIGEDCQDKKYKGEPTRLEIGDDNVFREGVTVHRGTVQDDGLTRIGSRNLFMVNAHVAHDCKIGNDNILANNSMIAGHVHVGDNVILGGATAVHQFCHIGSHSFTGGGAIILRDIPPYVMVSGTKHIPQGINSEGLKRRGFDSDTIMQIKRAYKALYRSNLRVDEAVREMAEMAKNTPEVAIMAEFVAHSPRGIIR